MTVVDGKISGPFVTMLAPYASYNMFLENYDLESFFGRYYSYDLQNGIPTNGNLSIYESNGELRCVIKGSLVSRVNPFHSSENGTNYGIKDYILNSDCTLRERFYNDPNSFDLASLF